MPNKNKGTAKLHLNRVPGYSPKFRIFFNLVPIILSDISASVFAWEPVVPEIPRITRWQADTELWKISQKWKMRIRVSGWISKVTKQ